MRTAWPAAGCRSCARTWPPTPPRSRRKRRKGADPDAVIDVRAIFQQGHRDLEIGDLRAVLTPRKGNFGLVDHDKVFAPDAKATNIFDARGINRQTGAIVAVRPYQYVAQVLPLHAHDALADFFAGILIEAN